MGELFSSYKLILKPITPVHIGDGEQVHPYEYVLLEDYLYKFNPAALYENLTEKDKELFQKNVAQSFIALRNWLGNIYDESLGYESKIKASAAFTENYNKKLRSGENYVEENLLALRSFVNTSGKAYIPGSSLKGALKGAYIYSMGKKLNIFDYTVKKDNIGRIDTKQSEWKKSADYENSILYKKSHLSDPFKSIRITDSIPVDEVLEVYDLATFTYKKQNDSFEKGVSYYALCTKSAFSANEEIAFEMGLNIFEGYYTSKGIKIKITLEDILASVNEKAADIIVNEIDFYNSKAKYDKTKVLYENLKVLYEALDKKSEALIRIGKGSGFDSTTFNLANLRRNNQTDSNSRNLGEKQYPLGWAVMKIV